MSRFAYLPWFDVAITTQPMTLWVRWRGDVYVPWDSPLVRPMRCFAA